MMLKDLFQFLIPQFVTDRVALNENNGEWSVVCLEHQVNEERALYVDAYGTCRTFTWLGIAIGGEVKLDD